MSGLIDSLIKMLKDSNAGFISTKVGEYTIIVTDDDDGAKVLNEAYCSCLLSLCIDRLYLELLRASRLFFQSHS